MDKLTFRALAIRQSELGSKRGDCGLRVCGLYTGGWKRCWWERGKTRSVRPAFVDSVAIESVDLKGKFCSRVLRPFVKLW